MRIIIPQISFVMSCYNAERWLSESIESVLGQTWEDFELIIVDDGSLDGTRQIVERYSDIDGRIVFVGKANTGLADSLNVGIKRARGAWIARMDADDVCEPHRLERQWRAAASDPALVFVGTGLVLIDEQGRRSSVYSYPPTHERLVKHLATGRRFPPHSSAFIRTDAFHRVGGYRTRFNRAQDWDLWLRLSEVGRLTCLQEPLIRHRIHLGQISRDKGGWRQLVDAYVAMVSYWLRRAGHADPVAGDAATFEAFRSWIVERLNGNNLIAMDSFHQTLEETNRQSFRTRGLAIAAEVLSHPRIAWLLAINRLRGSDLPRRLAAQWTEMRGFKGKDSYA